ncbi:MAG: DUF4339 domain-containing protein [Verrucomicrobiota bacterium]
MQNDPNEIFYFVILNEEQAGPYTIGQLRAMWQSGSVTAKTLFWCEGEEGWQPLIQLRALLETAPVEPAAAVPVTPTQPTPNLQSKDVIVPKEPNMVRIFAYGLVVILIIGLTMYWNSIQDDQEAANSARRISQASEDAGHELMAQITCIRTARDQDRVYTAALANKSKTFEQWLKVLSSGKSKSSPEYIAAENAKNVAEEYVKKAAAATPWQ